VLLPAPLVLLLLEPSPAPSPIIEAFIIGILSNKVANIISSYQALNLPQIKATKSDGNLQLNAILSNNIILKDKSKCIKI
jgi:hypothetical protein